MKNNIAAFTLLEIMVSLTILAILGSITIAGLNHLSTEVHDKSLCTSLTQLLNHAHHQADILRRTVTLCKSADQHHCGGEWSDGLLLFIDDAEDGMVHEDTQILSTLKNKISNGVLHARFYPKSRDYIEFRPLISASQDNGTFWYCHPSARSPSWAVSVNRMGVVTALQPDKHGEIKDAKEKILVC